MNDLITILQSHPLIVPANYIVISLLLGLVFHVILTTHIKNLSKKTKGKFDDILVAAIGRHTIIWFLLGGLYFAIPKLPLSEQIASLAYQIVIILTVGSVAIVVSRIATGSIDTYAAKERGGVQTTSIFSVLTKGAVFVIAALVIFQTFGVSITPILTALGVGGLAVALALQETLANLFAGLHLIASKKFKPGDFVELSDHHKGVITDITWRNTTIKTIGGNMVIVPNKNIAEAVLINYARPRKDMSVIVDLGVSYDSDLEQVEKITMDVAKRMHKKIQGGVKTADPLIRYKEFADSSINFAVILKIKEYTDQYRMKHEFIKAIHKRFSEEGIEIPFPQRDINVKGGEPLK